MNRSESLTELAKALCKAQAVIEGAAKDKTNPAFRSKYADLAACWDAARAPLTDNGLSVMQFPRLADAGIEIETLILHTSGEWASEVLTVPLAKRDAHGVGAAITYGRRFSFCSVVGICPEDDDGNKAVGKVDKETDDRNSPWTTELIDLATEAALRGSKEYKTFWVGLSEATRSVLVQTKEHAANKAAATKADSAALAAAAKEEVPA